jgi:hypothetical protein
MKRPLLGAWVLGVAIILAAYGVWFLSLYLHQFSGILMLALWCAPAIAALVCAYLSPYRKIMMGTSMAIPTAVFAGILNFVHERLGYPVDFPGYQGSIILVIITLFWSTLLCAMGSVLGLATRNALSKAKQSKKRADQQNPGGDSPDMPAS